MRPGEGSASCRGAPTSPGPARPAASTTTASTNANGLLAAARHQGDLQDEAVGHDP